MSKQNGLDTTDLYNSTERDISKFIYWCLLGAAAIMLMVLSDCSDKPYPVNPKGGTPITSTYDRPAAYRLSSPTQEQMDSMEHLRTIQRGK